MKDMIEPFDTIEEDLVILGGESDRKKRMPWWFWVAVGVVIIAAIVFSVVKLTSRQILSDMAVVSPIEADNVDGDVWLNNVSTSLPSCVVVTDTVVDSIRLHIFTPYNTLPSLHVGALDTSDANIIFATRAADLGYDKGQIIGAFVSEGEPLSWGGGRKLGYCAIIDGNITLGVSDNSPLFEQATEQDGYFFRQYPAVDNGVMASNNPKNASFRRALCVQDNRVCIIATFDRVLMNDFASILVKLGVKNAIFLVGGNADGLYRTKDKSLHLLGEEYLKNNKNVNYLVFRAQ